MEPALRRQLRGRAQAACEVNQRRATARHRKKTRKKKRQENHTRIGAVRFCSQIRGIFFTGLFTFGLPTLSRDSRLKGWLSTFWFFTNDTQGCYFNLASSPRRRKGLTHRQTTAGTARANSCCLYRDIFECSLSGGTQKLFSRIMSRILEFDDWQWVTRDHGIVFFGWE